MVGPSWTHFLALKRGDVLCFGVSVLYPEGKIVYFAEVNQRCCLEEIRQWLENVDGTHLLQDSGQQVPQKIL